MAERPCPECGAFAEPDDVACWQCSAPLPTVGVEPLSGGMPAAAEITFEPIEIGRSPDCDFVLTDEAVSARHCRLQHDGAEVLLEDLDSANGTWVDGRRIKRVRIGWRQPFLLGAAVLTPYDVVQKVRQGHFANATSVVAALDLDQLATDLGAAKSSTAFLAVGKSMVIGRDPGADIVLPTPNVSRRHARITRTASGLTIEDLGSTNGTWVNGRRISGVTPMEPSDDVRIGPQRLELSADGGIAAHPGISGVRLDVSKLSREVAPGKSVIDKLSFSILPGEMVAIMGPSGAGKTSALTTLAGYTPPTSGTVYLDGLDLYEHYDVFRSAIGYVPQEDVMHRALTVDEVLRYQARLRFRPDVGAREIDDRITAVLDELDLTEQRHSLVGDELRRGLSGGQRRRLNVAMELLSEPLLLLLDEPTSGLDARSAMQLIRQCRALANAGRTVVMTIHQPRQEAFELFDKLLLLTRGGKVAYFGPVAEVRRYFTQQTSLPQDAAANPADYALDALDPLDPAHARDADSWRDAFKASPHHQRFVRSRLRAEDRKADAAAARRPRRDRHGALRQLATLTSRYTRLKLRDRTALLVQMLQAPIIGLLGLLLFHRGRYHPIQLEDDITPTLFVCVAAAVWFGCSNVAREIVGEAAIYRRERMATLRAGPYLTSKLLVQGGLVTAQLAILLAILIPFVPLQGGLLPLIGTTALAGLAAMSMGLLVSTLARSELQAIQLVPLVILPQIMLSGILLPVAGAKASVVAQWLSKPVLLRWAYSAALHVEFAVGTLRGDKSRSSVGANFWGRNGFGDDGIVGDLWVMAGIGIACSVVSYGLLKVRDRR